jgi:pimeloyl-ACP methyl ester carboxylesterase
MVGDTGPCRDEAGSGIEPPVAPGVRRTFALLERFAPAAGSRWAVELWCTPPAVEMSLRMPPGVAAGEPVEATWSGHRIAGESWGDGPAVYLVHGWGGCRAHLGVFIKPLVEAGHRVIAFDLPSHNDSDPGELAPGRTTIVECAEAVRAFVHAHGPARGIIAHSLGAKAAALAVERGMIVERMVFLAPMGDFSLYLDLFAEKHGFGARIRTGLQRRLDRRLNMPLFDTDISAVATGLDDPPPLLVVHDPDDPDSPHAMSENLVGVWPGASLMTTHGLGRLAHYRILRHRPAIQAALDFIGTCAQPRRRAGNGGRTRDAAVAKKFSARRLLRKTGPAT